MFIKEEAIILKRSLFEEKASLIDLFCQQSGLVKLFVQGANTALHPFCLVECVLQKGKKDLYYLKEASCLALLPKERTPATLEVATRLSLALTSMTRDADVYALYKSFLSHAHMAKRPHNWIASFLLKLLAHEGLLSLDPPPSAHAFDAGEWLEEGPAWSLQFTPEEIQTLLDLARSRSLFDIDEKIVSETLVMKINQMFENAKGGT
jgi:hypothetical protein